MTTSRTALVTGANQGLGRALADTLAARMEPQDRVLLTGRDPSRVKAAAAAVAAGPAVAGVEGRVLDVRDAGAITQLAAELGEVDIVFSNAAARMSPEADPAELWHGGRGGAAGRGGRAEAAGGGRARGPARRARPRAEANGPGLP